MPVNVSWLRGVAAKRIRFFEEALAELGIAARFGSELEFVPLGKNGLPARELLHEGKMTAHLRKTVPGIERVHREIGKGAQYELVTGINPKMKHLGIVHASPSATAETLAAFQDGFAANAERWGIAGASYAPRQRVVGSMENSGLHTNISLWNADGMQNLFYKRGSPTTDLERHVIDALIENHGTATLAYLPNPESFARMQSTTFAPGTQTMAGLRDMLSGAPNVAGHMAGKGMVLSSQMEIAKGAFKTGKVPIPSVTSRYRSKEGMAFGLVERVTMGGVRSNMVGFETAAQHRLESRLAGADADPFVATAAEMAAVYDAVRNHVRPFDPRSFKATEQTVVEAGGKKLAVDLHRGEFKQLPLPESVESARALLHESTRMKELLGDDLYHGIIAHGLDATHPDATKYAESLAHVAERQHQVEPYATGITGTIRQALDTMENPAVEKSWAQRVSSGAVRRVPGL